MRTVEFLSHLREQDIRLWVDGDRLRIIAPKGTMTPELRSELAERKAEILDFLRATAVQAPPIRPAPREGALPLSFAQERMWFLDQLEPDSVAYNIGSAYRLCGPLNVAALERSILEIVRRHESLRTTFSVDDGKPYQVIAPSPQVQLPVLDMQGLPQEEREAEAIRLVTEDHARPFDLARGPLARTCLLRLGEEEHIWHLVMHHIITDGWSIGILRRELSLLYQAFAARKPSPLPDLPIQYADYAVWQREWLRGEVLESQLTYWRRQLEGSGLVLELPTDRPRPPFQSSRGARELRMLPKHLSQELKELSVREDVTLFMTLLAAFNVLLYRYSGQEDIIVGSPISGREHLQIEGMIGLFINTLVLRADLAGNPTFRQLLQRVRTKVLGAFEHQTIPFEELLKELQPERSLSHAPIFQVLFVLHDPEGASLEFPNLTVSDLEVKSSGAIADLTLSMQDEKDGLAALLIFNTDLFDADTMLRMLGNLQVLLEGIVADPDQPISRLPLLAETERRQQLADWNRTQVDFSTDTCVHQLFEAQVERTPDAVAVVLSAAGPEPYPRLTYRELNRKANHLAHHLRQQGVGVETLVGIYLERSLEMIVGVLGVLKAGGAYLPLDPLYPRDRLASMLEDAQVPVVLTQESLLARLPPCRARAICLDRDWETIAQGNGQNPNCNTTHAHLVYTIYTSGSTGRSKGVQVEHRSLVNAFRAWEHAYHLRSLHSHLQMASFSFDVFSGDLVRALCSGGKLVLCPREWLLDPQQLYKVMLQERVDCAEFVPAVLRHLIDYLDETQQNLAFLRLLACGSDSWYAGEYQRFLDFCGPDTRLINSFGLTEATIDSSYFEGSALNLPADQILPIGLPFANVQLKVLDPHLQPVPVGVVGELYVGGPGVARGYHNQPKLTAESFVPDPFGNRGGARLYKTGDLVRYLPDGNLEFLGRGDFQVKIRGFRVELGEIEAILAKHPEVQAVVALVRQDTRKEKRLVAYVVSNQEPLPTIGELRDFLKARLPDYMVPSAFVMMDALPLTPSGKVDRRALPAPDWSTRELEQVFVPPRTPVEEVLAGIWAEVLGLERVGVHDNYFDLGGHSLLATRVVSKISASFSVDFPLRSIFEWPTVAAQSHGLIKSESEPGQTERIARVLQRVAAMSDEEVTQMLRTDNSWGGAN